ncbi:MAG: DUF1735 and LamG domain-containing protein [Prevotellaceae bacterium]|nr:DUF1735 and LamG domain-containing protein [Prevotellaceae bacterium]MDY3364645.1 DUF1735 and LamG domain-containing protein [Prevotella sp.]
MIHQYIRKYSFLTLAGLALAVVTSCDNAQYDVLNNQAFIAQTKTNGNTSQKLTVEDEGMTEVKFNVQLSDPAREDCNFDLVLDQAALDRYNKEHFTNYKQLPENGYEMSAKTVKVAAGESLSDIINIKIKPFTEAQKKNAEKLAIPLKLVSKDGKQSVLSSGGSIVYLLDKVVRQAVPTYNFRNVIRFSMKEDLELTQWTVEFCVNADKLGEGVGKMNNQQLFCGWGTDGGEIFSRFGDAPIEGNRLNIKTQGGQLNSNTQFAANKWYHIAFVCTGTSLALYVNGVLDNTVNLPGKSVKLSRNNIWFGNNNERYEWLKANIKVSEFRLWEKALTQPQIANNMYAVDPASEGLFAYFKLDEGKGDNFTDARKNGNTAKVDGNGNIEWTSDVRIDGK